MQFFSQKKNTLPVGTLIKFNSKRPRCCEETLKNNLYSTAIIFSIVFLGVCSTSLFRPKSERTDYQKVTIVKVSVTDGKSIIWDSLPPPKI